MSDSTNTGGSTTTNTSSTTSDNSSSSSSDSSWFTGVNGLLIGIFGVIIVVLVFFGIFKLKESRDYASYFVTSYLGSAMTNFFDFLPLIYIVLGFLLDAVNTEFQASKISIASLVAVAGQVIMGLIMRGYQGLVNTVKGITTLDSEFFTLGELIPGFLDSCKITLLGFNVEPTNYGQTSNFTLVTFFIAFSYLASLSLVNVNNPNEQYTSNYWIGPVVMAGLAFIGMLFRTFKPNSCDSLLSSLYGVIFAAIWSSIFIGVGYYSVNRIVPYANKIFKYTSSPSILSGATRPNTSQSCATPQGEGVVYEIYQDGEMVGQV
jgi:hypothetical protein